MSATHYLHFAPGEVRAVTLHVGEYERYSYEVVAEASMATGDEVFHPFIVRVQVPLTRQGWPPALDQFTDLTSRRAIVLCLCGLGFVPHLPVSMDDEVMTKDEIGALPDPRSSIRALRRMTDLLWLLGDPQETYPREAALIGTHRLVGHGMDFLVFEDEDGRLRPLFVEDLADLTVGWPTPRLRIRWVQKPDDVGGYSWLRRPLVGRTQVPEKRGPHLPSRRLLGVTAV